LVEDGKVLQEWTLIMGYTLEKQPIIGEAPGREELWICAGFHGHGENIGMGFANYR
jgi:glycine/D-amino acid oxidase-like deaminating enzyme